MEQIELGKSGVSVSRICLGSWQASGWASSNDQGFMRTVQRALDLGVNFIDTAELYGNGHAEELIGRVLRGQRDRVVLASKVAHTNCEAKKLRRSLEQSLRRLGTEYLDLYQQHWPNAGQPSLEETVAELVKLKKEGKIRIVGVSNWMEPEWGELSDPSPVECLQPCYSLLWRSIEAAVLPLCRKHGIAVVPYSPLCQGLLTGRFTALDQVPQDWRKHNRLFRGAAFDAALKVVSLLRELGEKYSKPLSAVALRWLLDQHGITAPIVGASSPEQIEENVQALGWRLDPGDWQRLAECSQPVSAGLSPHDTLWSWHPREVRK